MLSCWLAFGAATLAIAMLCSWVAYWASHGGGKRQR
jgi:hypothetical protein